MNNKPSDRDTFKDSPLPSRREARRLKKEAEKARPVPQARRDVPKPRASSRMFDAAVLVALMLASMAFSTGIFSNQLFELLPEAGQYGVRAIVSVVFYGVMLLALSYIAYRHHESFKLRFRLCSQELKDSRAHKLKSAAISSILVMGLLVLTRLLAIGWTYIADQVGWQPSGTQQLLSVFGESIPGLVFAALNVIIFAPFVEELIFRGVLQEWLDTKMPSFAAVLVAAGAFALYHLSPWAFIPNFILGVATGYLALKRPTLWPAIFLHLLYNATLLGAALYAAAF